MSGGNSNITVAIPGNTAWDVWWWNGLENFQLDIVGFLAVLGESAVLVNAQVAALSRLFYLPRILPAPQALIRTVRPTSLPRADGKVTGVVSGNVKDHVHHVANILLGQPMPKFMVRCVEVTETDAKEQTWADTFLRGQAKRTPSNMSDTRAPSNVRAKASGPLTWVTLIGFLEALTLFIASIVFGDGMSLLATILLASVSTIVGVCNKWTLRLPQMPKSGQDIPKGDVVIRYPNGSFLVVKCSEHAARELFFAPEELDYQIESPVVYRLLSLAGTLALMVGIVALANAKLYLQVAWAGAYIIINIAHWIAAALPPSAHWDLSCYRVKEQGLQGGPDNANFTEALWKAILLTQSIEWVRPGGAAPQTTVWNNWLEDAKEKAKECANKFDKGPLDYAFWPEAPDSKVSTDYLIWKVPKWEAKKQWDEMNKKTNAEPFNQS